jgi:microcystin-dependent protein
MAIQHTPTLQLPYPESTDTANVPRDIKALADAMDPLGVAPVGAMFMWPAATAPADVDGTGRALWLLMLGQALPAATYPKLAALLGSAGGNVTIPNMRDVFPVGAGAAALLSAGGAASVALTAAQIPSHIHGVALTAAPAGTHGHSLSITGSNVVDPQHVFAVAGGVSHVFWGANLGSGDVPLSTADNWHGEQGSHGHIGSTAVAVGDHTHTVNGNTATLGGDGTHENRPPFRAVNFIIRAG